MNGKDLLRGLSYIDIKYIQRAEFGDFSLAAFQAEDVPPSERKRLPLRKILLLAATIALLFLLVGCGVAYVLKMQNLKLGQSPVLEENWDAAGVTRVEETVQHHFLNLSGLKGSANYQAAKAWHEFKQSYDPDHIIQMSVWDDPKEFPPEYELYDPYTQEMVDKLDEITQEYGLKLAGTRIESETLTGTQAYLGIDSLLLPGAPASLHSASATARENGYFRSEFDIEMDDGEDAWPYTSSVRYVYTPKDCFNPAIIELSDTENWEEETYTTASGYDLLILRSPTDWRGWIFCDRGNATIYLRLEVIQEVYTDEKGYQEVLRTPMTRKQLEQLLDCIDFSIKPQPGDPALLKAPEDPDIPPPSPELVQTQNGCTLEVKRVHTDGYRAAITLSLTAPEDVSLSGYLRDPFCSLSFDDCQLTPTVDVDRYFFYGFPHPREDGDGKDNTVEFVLIHKYTAKDIVPIQNGSVWNLYLSGLSASKWNQEILRSETLWEMDGVWNFEITFQDGDYRELEFITTPITAKGNTGFREPRRGVYEEVFEDVLVTSITMRAYGGEITKPDRPGASFYFPRYDMNPQLILKDGTQIPVTDEMTAASGEYMDKPIPLEEIDYLLLDGNKLYPRLVE